MTSTTSAIPSDVIAIFHTSFHAQKGNIIDFSLRIRDDLNLEGIEFSSLPSGLHLVDEDVIYFTKDAYHGICVFRRQQTDEPGMRGFRLGAVGVLVAETVTPRPWRHRESLKGLSKLLDDQPDDRTSLTEYFDKYKYQKDTFVETSFADWDTELLVVSHQSSHPILHLPHLLRIFGPSYLTLYKHVLSRRRILIYTHPAVEPACLLARVAAETCFSHAGDTRRGFNIFGMVGLSDMAKLEAEAAVQAGWIACTTDAIFLEKPHIYDLMIDLTTFSPTRVSRPTLYLTRIPPSSAKNNKPRLQPVRFTLSDLRLWKDIDCILTSDSVESGSNNNKAPSLAESASGRWHDPWRLYEDVCIICSGLWVGSCRRGVKLEGDEMPLDTPSLRQRGEGEPTGPNDIKDTVVVPMARDGTSSAIPSRDVRATLALLSVFQRHTLFVLDRLADLVAARDKTTTSPGSDATPLILTPRDLLTLELGTLSELDARFVEWIALAHLKKTVVVRRTWKDLFSAFFGF